MLREFLSRCEGFVIARLILRNLPYNQQLMNVMVQCLPFTSVLNVFVDGVAFGHDQVHRILEVNAPFH